MDIKQITLNGVYYNLKDQAARTALAACVNAGNYNPTDKLLEFKNGNALLFSIDATAFIKDGMVSSVVIDNGYLVITFNTDSGKEPIRISLTDIFNPNNYYTKQQIDNFNTILHDAIEAVEVKEWVGTQAEFDKLTEFDEKTTYYII